MDNQQEIMDLSWLAGVLDADGTIAINSYQNKNGSYQFHVKLGWYGTSQNFVDRITEILERYEIPHYVSWAKQRGYGSKPQARIEITGMKRNFRAIPFLEPYVRTKKHQLKLFAEFIRNRVRKWKNRARVDDEDIALYHKFKETVY